MWLRADASHHDVLWLPASIPPVAGIPCPSGQHIRVFRQTDTWGLYDFRPGPAETAHGQPFPVMSDSVDMPCVMEDAPISVQDLVSPSGDFPTNQPAALPVDGASSDRPLFSSSDSGSAADTANAPDDDSHCLLQRRAHLLTARLTEAIPPVEPISGVSLGFADATHAPQQLQLTVWRPALPPAVLHFDRAATAGHVNEALLPLLHVHDASSSLVPVYPALDDSLHCVCTAGLDVCRAFLVVITGDSLPPGQTLAVEPPCTDRDILRQLGCDKGLLTLSQQPWTGTQHGIYQGMHLRLQYAPPVRHADVSHLHRIATPCRNQGSVRHVSRLQPADSDAPAACLEETTPPPRPPKLCMDCEIVMRLQLTTSALCA